MSNIRRNKLATTSSVVEMNDVIAISTTSAVALECFDGAMPLLPSASASVEEWNCTTPLSLRPSSPFLSPSRIPLSAELNSPSTFARSCSAASGGGGGGPR
jgi:hypothetical protein